MKSMPSPVLILLELLTDEALPLKNAPLLKVNRKSETLLALVCGEAFPVNVMMAVVLLLDSATLGDKPAGRLLMVKLDCTAEALTNVSPTKLIINRPSALPLLENASLKEMAVNSY